MTDWNDLISISQKHELGFVYSLRMYQISGELDTEHTARLTQIDSRREETFCNVCVKFPFKWMGKLFAYHKCTLYRTFKLMWFTFMVIFHFFSHLLMFIKDQISTNILEVNMNSEIRDFRKDILNIVYIFLYEKKVTSIIDFVLILEHSRFSTPFCFLLHI